MSRRASDANLGFGSDSFLDIVANIVGILIILIVLAGVRVSKMPVLPEGGNAPLVIGTIAQQPVTPTPLPPAAPIPIDEPVDAVDTEVGGGERDPAASSPPVVPQPPAEPSPLLLATLAEMQQQLSQLSSEQTAAAAKLNQLSAQRGNRGHPTFRRDICTVVQLDVWVSPIRQFASLVAVPAR